MDLFSNQVKKQLMHIKYHSIYSFVYTGVRTYDLLES
jgi:uncharacterized protein involved in tellurium resistance